MGTPLGDFIRTTRDSVQPESLGLPVHGRRRAPGLRRIDLASRAGVSVEYLTRIEQGRDINPSVSVVNALADALGLDRAERNHLRYLAKITGGECATHQRPSAPSRRVRPAVLTILRSLEPGIAVVTNRLGDVLACTTGYDVLVRPSGLLDAELPNLTRYTFTDPRAHSFFRDWDAVADEQAFDLWIAPSIENTEWMSAELARSAGPDFTRRLHKHQVPPRGDLALRHPSSDDLRFRREVLDLSGDQQQLVVLLPADEATAEVVAGWRGDGAQRLRSIS